MIILTKKLLNKRKWDYYFNTIIITRKQIINTKIEKKLVSKELQMHWAGLLKTYKGPSKNWTIPIKFWEFLFPSIKDSPPPP